MSDRTHRILTTSDEPNWLTPTWLLQALNREFAIGLDAASDGTRIGAANGMWLGPDSPYGITDALGDVPWGSLLDTREAAFCNPPYSGKLHLPIGPWIARLAAEGAHRAMIGVIPYAPQTVAWRRYVVGFDCRATEIRRIPFRLKFDPPPGYIPKAEDGKTHGANVNTAVVIWRPTDEYPRALPWAPFERYWVPAECPNGRRYHTATGSGEGDA